MDIFVLTSLWEGLPVTLLEAMASSKPVIVTHTGGVAEVVSEGKNGFLVQPKDMQAMSEKLILLLKDGSLRRAMSNNAGSMLDTRFWIENTVKANQELYNQCM
jgi:glycosyltransferase involved in cell wall biosynthesis